MHNEMFQLALRLQTVSRLELPNIRGSCDAADSNAKTWIQSLVLAAVA